jgi:hypothetical protein
VNVWILILVYHIGYGATSMAVEFSSEYACRPALEKTAPPSWGTDRVIGVCVEKNKERK